ncbi:MAG: flagellar filament capping protein FliD [Epsilonproteobacteria bacterium]|nr:flagellar filament capping protein FliD [Campylobacterota bacterium]
MAGALSTLGLGSQGVLTNDIIDQLKEADESALLTPITTNISTVNAQKKSITEMKTLLKDLSDIATTLSDSTHYKNKSSELVGESVSITATSSAQTQNFDIEVTKLATRDIKQSTGFASKTDTLSAGSMNLQIDGNSYDITIEATDTLESLVDKINEATDGNISASILNVGGSDPYKLILKSTETGSTQNITASGDIAFSQVGSGATDAELSIDGISVTKASNEIDDLVEGVTINLQQTGKTTVDIKQDNEKILEEMNKFVEQYNSLLSKVTSATNYDTETKTAGVFQGSSEIRNIKSSLSDILNTAISTNGSMIEDFGLTADSKSGQLTLDEDKFTGLLDSDIESVTSFFIGEGSNNGIFRELSSTLFDMSSSSTGVIKTLSTNFDDRLDSLQDSYDKTQERLDSRYEIMQKRFAAFDSVISKLTNQSDALQSMIDAQSSDS